MTIDKLFEEAQETERKLEIPSQAARIAAVVKARELLLKSLNSGKAYTMPNLGTGGKLRSIFREASKAPLADGSFMRAITEVSDEGKTFTVQAVKGKARGVGKKKSAETAATTAAVAGATKK